MGQSSFEGEGEGCLGDGMSKDRCCDKESPRLQLPHAVNMELMIDPLTILILIPDSYNSTTPDPNLETTIIHLPVL